VNKIDAKRILTDLVKKIARENNGPNWSQVRTLIYSAWEIKFGKRVNRKEGHVPMIDQILFKQSPDDFVKFLNRFEKAFYLI